MPILSIGVGIRAHFHRDVKIITNFYPRGTSLSEGVDVNRLQVCSLKNGEVFYGYFEEGQGIDTEQFFRPLLPADRITASTPGGHDEGAEDNSGIDYHFRASNEDLVGRLHCTPR